MKDGLLLSEPLRNRGVSFPFARVARLPFPCVTILFLFLSLSPGRARSSPAAGGDLEMWWVDSLEKLLVDAPPGRGGVPGRIDAARGETEAIQLALRSATPCRASAAADSPAPGISLGIRAVGRVPIRRGTHRTPPEERVALPPADIPDPLFFSDTIDLDAGATESFWIDVTVSRDAKPGLYRTAVLVRGEGETVAMPLEVRIYSATVPFEGKLKVANWFSVKPRELGFGDAKPGGEAWWKCADLLFDSMWAHRQNFFWTPLRPPWIRPVAGAAGGLSFDFSFFDRWVEAFSRPRGGKRKTYIEGQPIASRRGGYDGTVKARVWRVEKGAVREAVLPAEDPAAREGYRLFLTALRDHLEERGWLDRFRIHICDEPHGRQLGPYAAIAGYVRAFAPEFLIMEALDVRDDFAFFEKNVDVWVPQLGRFEKSLPRMTERLKRGKEVWIYTCLFPNGKYPNRFIDYPLIKTRVLQWIDFKWGFSGYLHWGFNHWRGDPFKDVEPRHTAKTFLPPGDAWVVYPGRCRVIDSMRHEALRDGVEDYELLDLLAGRGGGPKAGTGPARGAERNGRAAAMDLAGRIVRTFTDYERDPARFRKIRRALLEALSGEER